MAKKKGKKSVSTAGLSKSAKKARTIIARELRKLEGKESKLISELAKVRSQINALKQR